MRLVDWSGSKLRATDDTGSSDPFLKFGKLGISMERTAGAYAAVLGAFQQFVARARSAIAPGTSEAVCSAALPQPTFR